ncbi:unnamed protein product [Lactuca saligna]|uniref:YDG domain-containing protein n=1 Tax=Lactuca saligna TaxID=75948 RepID=A0AA36EER2_LACSI|nr:unnamed protein product [Lactuca saligna]
MNQNYTYDGLYKVVKYWAEKGVSGFYVYKFLLKRMEGQPSLVTDIANLLFLMLGCASRCTCIKEGKYRNCHGLRHNSCKVDERCDMGLDEKLLDNLTSQPSLKSRGPNTGYKSSTITDNGLSVFLVVSDFHFLECFLFRDGTIFQKYPMDWILSLHVAAEGTTLVKQAEDTASNKKAEKRLQVDPATWPIMIFRFY